MTKPCWRQKVHRGCCCSCARDRARQILPLYHFCHCVCLPIISLLMRFCWTPYLNSPEHGKRMGGTGWPLGGFLKSRRDIRDCGERGGACGEPAHPRRSTQMPGGVDALSLWCPNRVGKTRRTVGSRGFPWAQAEYQSAKRCSIGDRMYSAFRVALTRGTLSVGLFRMGRRQVAYW
jgi:hypothetical protein